MNASIEDRLSAALSARADQVRADDLTPSAPPATVTPLRLLRPALYVAAAAAVAVVATVVGTLGDDDTAAPDPSSTPTVVDPSTPAPTTTPPSTPSGPTFDGQPIDDLNPVGEGTEVEFLSGARGHIDGDGAVHEDRRVIHLVIDDGDVVRRNNMGETTALGRSLIRLSSVELQLGQAGRGYLVYYDDPARSMMRLYVPAGEDGLVLDYLDPYEYAPFGNGSGVDNDGLTYDTFTTGTGSALYTREQLGRPGQQRYTVYRWEVTGPGEGGGGTYQTFDGMVSTDLGTYCFDDAGNGERC